MEMGNARVLFVEEIYLAGKSKAGISQMRLITFADYLHVHPSQCSLPLAPKLTIYFRFPLFEAGLTEIEKKRLTCPERRLSGLAPIPPHSVKPRAHKGVL